ncbi:MAG: penicillin-binding transpeptidase domain-containing protein [Eubacteriales bacterium]
MSKVNKNIIKASIFVMLLFLVLVAAFLINLFSLSGKLINSPYNKRLKELREATIIGSIYDTNNVLLAGSSDEGKRQYSENEILRNAVSHLIGDTYGYCPTGADIQFGSILLNYNESLFSKIKRQIQDVPHSGSDIQLSVDCRLNIFAYDKTKDYKGAVVVQDYTTGEILCMVSAPSFDPETIIKDLEINTEKEAFVNRAIQGQYAPGSIFHIITAGAAIENIDDILSRKYSCESFVKIDNEKILCDDAHGYITIKEAFAQSCDVVFAQLGVELGAKNIKSFAEQLQFNHDFSYADIGLYPSSITVSKNEEDAAFAYAAIGQHENIVTPLHMSMIAGAIANDGIMMMPSLLKSVDGQLISKGGHGTRIISEDTNMILQSFMQNNIPSQSDMDGFEVCCTDGVSVSSKDGSLYNNSWFLGYINNSEHPLVICMILEQSYIDSNPATQIAHDILEYAYSLGY